MPGLAHHLVLTELELAALAERLALHLCAGDSIALRGDLGAGKTAFARALIRALVGDPLHDVPSPTFALRQDYESARGAIVHFDLYRIADPRELDEIGFDEALQQAITVIEWPERAGTSLPPVTLAVTLQEADVPDRRRVTIVCSGNIAVCKALVGP